MPNTAIKILHVCDKWGVGGSSVHGVSRALSRWIRRLDESRYPTTLIGLRGGGSAQAELEREGLRIIDLAKGKFDPSTLPALVRQIRAQRPDILHLHGYGATNFGLLAGFLTRTPTIVHEHFVDPNPPRYQLVSDFFLARLSTLNIACSKAVRQFMVEKRSFAKDKIRILYYGAPLDEFKPISEVEAQLARERLGIPARDRVVGAVGRLDTQKGFAYLIDAVPIVLETHQDVRFVLVGDGPLHEHLSERAKERGVEDRVLFAGFQREPQRIQTLFDVQVFPSLWEGIPLTVVEAMAMGVPIVSTNVDGITEALVDGDNALIVPPRDSQSLGQQISRLLSNESLAGRLGAKAKVDSKKFDVDETANRLAMIYEEVHQNSR